MLKYFLPLVLCACASAAPIPLTPDAKGFPQGWKAYGKGPGIVKIEKGLLHIADKSEVNEWGICRTFNKPAPGKYEITVEASGSLGEAQIVLIPAGHKLKTLPLSDTDQGEFRKFRMQVVMPDCPRYTLYIYGRYQGTPDFVIRSIDISQVKEFTKTTANVIGTPGAPPVITKLKPLHLTTPLKQAVIAAGNTPELQKAAQSLAAKFGARIVPADSVQVPLQNHVIAIGNRANNELINKLYTRGFCYTDLVYPGKGGYELRSLHNPTGKGFNVILCGGSDDAGAVQAAKNLEKSPAEAGFLMDLKVPGFKKPFNAYDTDHYYLTGGYYGWNYISGMMALFYQTGDTFYAKEFLRLAFPDAQAIRDFKKFNAESLELPNDPLAGPYHYAAHHMILLWDLIEEHPIFTDQQRLDVTNAFSRQWKHHVRWTRPAGPNRLTTSSRHGQWAQISNYVLGRYFMRDYPAPTWADAIKRAECEFAVTNKPDGWIEGERGIVPWFVSGSINPACQFYGLTGGASYNPEGALANAFNFMYTQWDGTGRSDVLGTAYRQTFYLAAEHTGDGKFIWFADLLRPYTKGKFKLGASYSPTGKIKSRKPTELLNTWIAAPMKKGEHKMFGIKDPIENCYLGIGWRNTLDSTGDWISFNCFNESYRTPFKLLSLTGLRLDGHKLLQGFGSFVQPTRSGVAAREIPTVGQIYNYGQAGNAVYSSGGVPKHAYSAWQRDLLLRPKTFVLLADTITPDEKSDLPITVMINMQAAGSVQKTATGNQVQFAGSKSGNTVMIKDLECKGIPACTISSGPRNTLFETKKVGDKAVIVFHIAADTEANPSLLIYDHSSRAGGVNIYLDGKKVLSNVPHFTATAELSAQIVSLGHQKLAKGKHTIELEVASVSPQASACWIGVSSLALNLRNKTGFDSRAMALTASAGEIVTRTGNDIAIKRNLASDPAQPVTTFSLFCQNSSMNPVTASTVANNAAVFYRPEPMLVFCRDYANIGSGTMVVMENDRISGQGVTRLGNYFAADAPVGLDWEFGKSLILSGKAGTAVTVNGKKYALDGKGALTIAKIAPAGKSAYIAAFRNITSAARKNIITGTKSGQMKAADARLQEINKLPAGMTFIRPTKAGFLAGVGTHLLVLDKNYRVKLDLPMSAVVQSAVQAGDLYIAGAKDEEIAAFNAKGQKVWRFTSVLAPSVEATQKYYWFKKPYPGLFALEYRDGRIYAGSACTMEVLDLKGNLIKRHPQTWGPCRQIYFIDQPNGSYNAVGLRHSATDGVYMWTVNSKTGVNTTNYRTNVTGYRHFPSFGSLHRTRAFVGDFDGDGAPELIADAQGLYTWINLYDANGRADRQINLGPGKVIRAWTAGDFTGDARPDAAVSTWNNQLLAIDGTCKPLWTADLPFKGSIVEVNAQTREVIVSDMRHICKVDGKGKITAFVRLPEAIDKLWCHDGKVYVARGNTISCLKF